MKTRVIVSLISLFVGFSVAQDISPAEMHDLKLDYRNFRINQQLNAALQQDRLTFEEEMRQLKQEYRSFRYVQEHGSISEAEEMRQLKQDARA